MLHHLQWNINVFLESLMDIDYEIKKDKNKEEETKKLKTKQEEFNKYLQKWIPIFIKTGENGPDTFISNHIVPLLKNVDKRQLMKYCPELLNAVDLKLIINTLLSFKKLEIMQRAGEGYFTVISAMES